LRLLFKGFSASPVFGFYPYLQYTTKIFALTPVFTLAIPRLPACSLNASLPTMSKQPNAGACFPAKIIYLENTQYFYAQFSGLTAC